MTKFERILVTSSPVTFIRNSSRKFTLPGFKGLTFYEVFNGFVSQVKVQGLNIRAAAISFNLIMAIPATTLFLCTLVPYLPASKQIYIGLMNFVRDFTPNSDTQKILTQFLNDFFNKKATGLVSIGFLLVVFTSSNAMMGIIRAFDRSLSERRKTNFIKKRLRAIRLTSILMILLIGTVLISVGQGLLFKKLMQLLNVKNDTVRWLIQNFRWVVIFALFVFSVGVIYKYAPSYTVKRQLITPGAVFASLLMVVATSLLSYWAQNMSNLNKFYGSIGSLILLMLLIFVNSLMLLVGYEINLAIAILSGQKRKESLKNVDNADALLK